VGDEPSLNSEEDVATPAAELLQQKRRRRRNRLWN
jgi:hypothetical protein